MRYIRLNRFFVAGRQISDGSETAVEAARGRESRARAAVEAVALRGLACRRVAERREEFEQLARREAFAQQNAVGALQGYRFLFGGKACVEQMAGLFVGQFLALWGVGLHLASLALRGAERVLQFGVDGFEPFGRGVVEFERLDHLFRALFVAFLAVAAVIVALGVGRDGEREHRQEDGHESFHGHVSAYG